MNPTMFSVSYPWDDSGYKPDTRFYLSVDEQGFRMNIVVKEENPRAVEEKHQRDVYQDSCAEWFVNFQPECFDRYFNFEVNANGAMYAALRKDRYEYRLLILPDITCMDVKSQRHKDYWEVWYTVPFRLIEKYIPGYGFRKGMKIRANFYKCGARTPYPHYGIWKEYSLEKPDFHRPELFGEVEV